MWLIWIRVGSKAHRAMTQISSGHAQLWREVNSYYNVRR